MEPLNALQRRLERIYEIRLDYRVGDFVITDPELLAQLEGAAGTRSAPEKLLVRQQDDALDVTLYLDAEVVDRLTGTAPDASPHPASLADYCTALEGVSHFLYLLWHAGHGRWITQLELEMQAEVDKYITSAWALRRHDQHLPAQLHHWLFTSADYASDLSRSELERYRDASHYAGSYCQQLAERYLRPQQMPGDAMLKELRRFYRLPLSQKIRRIEQRH